MRSAALIVLAAAGLTACAPPFVHRGAEKLKPIARLTCPESEDGLNRSSQASDGSACAYSGPGGATVQLNLVRLSGAPESAVEPIEAQLKAELPPPPPPPATPSSTGDRDKVDIHLPGISIQAGDQGAKINAPGVHIDADNQHSSVHVIGQGPAGAFGGPPGRGQVTVDANDGGAVIHTMSFGRDFDENLILVSKTPGPRGWRTVGYEALGPRSGPLVVATVRSASDEHEELFNEVKSLVRRVARG